MNSNFEYYKVFYYVAKYENLTKASSVLKTSQPAVTRTIHNLENELGCRLFTRSKSGMKLTPEGRTFYSYVSAGCAQFFKGENVFPFPFFQKHYHIITFFTNSTFALNSIPSFASI